MMRADLIDLLSNEDICDTQRFLKYLHGMVLKSIGNNIPGLLSGDLGAIIFLSNIKESNLVDFENIIDIESICLELKYSVSKHPLDLSFCSGLAGIGWGAQYLKSESLDEISDLIKKVFKNSIDFSGFDEYEFLYGATGVGLYGASHRDPVFRGYITSKIVSFLKYKAKHTEQGLYWETEGSNKAHLDDIGPNQVNFGIAHGVFGPIAFLVKLEELGLSSKDSLFMLSESVRFIIHNLNKMDFSSAVPTAVSLHVEPNSRNNGLYSRIGWCYGDLMSALILSRVGKSLRDQVVFDLSKKIAIKTIGRYSNKLEILDCGICHGSLGLVLIYRALYFQFNDLTLLNESKVWLKHALDKFRNSDSLTCPTTPGSVDNISLIDGYSGMGMVILDILRRKNGSWNESILVT